MFQAAIGAQVNVEILSRGSWRAGFTLVVERMQSERVFLGGAAAYLFTPAGGLGYNTTIEDAVNPDWKLAAVRAAPSRGSLCKYCRRQKERQQQQTEALADAMIQPCPALIKADANNPGQIQIVTQ